MGISNNRGTPKSSILIWFSTINHPFSGTPIFGNIHIYIYTSEIILNIPLFFLNPTSVEMEKMKSVKISTPTAAVQARSKSAKFPAPTRPKIPSGNPIQNYALENISPFSFQKCLFQVYISIYYIYVQFPGGVSPFIWAEKDAQVHQNGDPCDPENVPKQKKMGRNHLEDHPS